MYSSSSSSTNPQYQHDVFINFIGEDTCRKFVSRLYAVLSNAGINTFLDDVKLQKGKEIGNELFQAISVSRISIVVFSKKYAESSWCLNELETIMECRRTQGQLVLPVFYDVDPSDVRHQKGQFGKTLEMCAKCKYMVKEFRERVLGRWKEALNEASKLTGFDGKTFRSDRELVNKIVEAILPKLDNNILPITEFPDVKRKPSLGVEVQLSADVKKTEPSPLTVKTKLSPKPNEKIFARIARSVRVCFCSNQSFLGKKIEEYDLDPLLHCLLPDPNRDEF